MIGAAGRADAVMLQELAAGAGVFGKNQIGLLKHVQRAEGDIVEIAHGRGDQIEFCHKEHRFR